MTQEQKLIFDALDELGGEPLEDSGFQTEEQDSDFGDENSAEVTGRRS